MDLRQSHGIITPASWPQGPTWTNEEKRRKRAHLSRHQLPPLGQLPPGIYPKAADGGSDGRAWG